VQFGMEIASIGIETRAGFFVSLSSVAIQPDSTSIQGSIQNSKIGG